MGMCSIHSLEPGMVLAREVVAPNGRRLLPPGAPLTAKHIRILKMWGVPEADIQGATEQSVHSQAMGDFDPEMLAQAEAWAAQAFRLNDMRTEAVAAVARFCLRRKVVALAAGGEPSRTAPHRPPDALMHELAPFFSAAALDPDQLLAGDDRFGSLPMIVHRLVEAMNDLRCSAADVADIISSDIDLASRVLRMVNSPFYGLAAPIDTVSRAVALLGGNQLASLAIGLSVVTVFKGIPDDLVNMRSFWTHSISCGVGARILSSRRRAPNSERFFVAGLLHDVGRLLVFKQAPEYSHMLLQQELGARLLQRWKFPTALEESVRFHHEPWEASNRLDAAILHTADFLAHALELGASGERLVPRLSPEAFEALEGPASMLTETAAQMETQVADLLGFFTSP